MLILLLLPLKGVVHLFVYSSKRPTQNDNSSSSSEYKLEICIVCNVSTFCLLLLLVLLLLLISLVCHTSLTHLFEISFHCIPFMGAHESTGLSAYSARLGPANHIN